MARELHAAVSHGLTSSPRGRGARTWRLDRHGDPYACAAPDGCAGLAREDAWAPGTDEPLPARQVARSPIQCRLHRRRLPASLDRAWPGQSACHEAEIVALFEARGPRLRGRVPRGRPAAGRARRRRRDLRRQPQHQLHQHLHLRLQVLRLLQGPAQLRVREKPYDLGLEEIARRTREAWERGATEVCLQGGIRPGYTGETYLAIVGAVKSAAPDIHVHAFSPLEIWHGAETLGLPLRDYLARLKARRSRQPARHRRRDPRRRGARDPLPRQDQHRAMARGDGGRARRGPQEHRDHHVRPRRRLPPLGAPSAARARAADAHRRLHRVRAAAVRAHGGADLSQGPGAQGADVPRGRAHACRGAAGARSASSPTSRPPG